MVRQLRVRVVDLQGSSARLAVVRRALDALAFRSGD